MKRQGGENGELVLSSSASESEQEEVPSCPDLLHCRQCNHTKDKNCFLRCGYDTKGAPNKVASLWKTCNECNKRVRDQNSRVNFARTYKTTGGIFCEEKIRKEKKNRI